MSTASQNQPQASGMIGAVAVVQALLNNGVRCGFGIPSIHNIALYEVLRRQPEFRHWIVRHEQAAVFAADGFCRRSGKQAAVFASTGPGNLFTVAALLESFQTNTPVVVIGTNVASALLGKTCGALHETPQQLEIIRPLTRFAARISSPDAIAETVAAAVHAGGPAFIEIPHDLLLAPVTWTRDVGARKGLVWGSLEEQLPLAAEYIEQSAHPAIVLGADVIEEEAIDSVRELAEKLQAPVMTTTSGKGAIADDHALSMGCISRLGPVQELLSQSDLLISVGARFTEFDTGRYTLKPPARHLEILHEFFHAGLEIPAEFSLGGNLSAIARHLASAVRQRSAWWDVFKSRKEERQRLESLESPAFKGLMALRDAVGRDDVVVNDQSILNYWASAFFPVLAPRTFLYPTGSGTLGYGLPAAIGAACAAPGKSRVICIAGDGGFQYTSHELATLAQYDLPVKILLVNDCAYGIIGFLQRSLFGHTHEVQLKNPDFCALAAAHGIAAHRATDLDGLRGHLSTWLNSPGPALLEWRTELKAPWESGAIHRPTNLSMKETS